MWSVYSKMFKSAVGIVELSVFLMEKLDRRYFSGFHFHRFYSQLTQRASSCNCLFVRCARTNLINGSAEYCSFDKGMEQSLDYSKFSELAQDSHTEKQIKLLLMEYEIAKQSGGRVPSTITFDEMKELLDIPSERGRTRYFNYLFKKEMAEISDKRRKERRRIEYEKRKQERQAAGPKNTFFLHIRDQSMLKFYNSRQAHSMMFGSTLVFDMGYDEYMTKREKINCAYQISIAYGANKVHREPFNLYLCNVKSDCGIMKVLENAIPHLHAPNCLINVTELSYLDIFPKDRLVYLTPNADKTLKNFDHDTIYVIGGFVDKSKPMPLSLAKAKRENLRMAKLPLDYYLHWGLGSKSLTINQVMDIMLEIKSSNNWKEAFKFVPTRKVQKIDLNTAKVTKSKMKAANVTKLALLEDS